MNNQFREEKNLWRIINTDDIVPRVPPSHLLSNIYPYVTKNDPFNYFKIGDEIHFYLNSNEPKGITLREKTKLDGEIDKELDYNILKKILEEDKRGGTHHARELYNSYDSKGRIDKLYNKEFRIPSYIRNHMPHRYFIAMERLRSEKIVPMVGFL